MTIDEAAFLRDIIEGLKPEFERINNTTEKRLSHYDEISKARTDNLQRTITDEAGELHRLFSYINNEVVAWTEDYKKQIKEHHERIESNQKQTLKILDDFKESQKETNSKIDETNKLLEQILSNFSSMAFTNG